MTDKEQAYCMLKQFLEARKSTPWIADWFEVYGSIHCTGWMLPGMCINRMGGMLGSW